MAAKPKMAVKPKSMAAKPKRWIANDNNGLNASARGPLHKERAGDCENARVKKKSRLKAQLRGCGC